MANSSDGGGILDHCILKIRETTGKVLYTAPNIKEPVIEIKGNDKDGYHVEYNKKVVFNCGSRKLAEKEKSRLM